MSATGSQRSAAIGPSAPIAYDSPAYSRINGMVVVGEGLADRHFRRLTGLLPHDREELLRLGAMEARHARRPWPTGCWRPCISRFRRPRPAAIW